MDIFWQELERVYEELDCMKYEMEDISSSSRNVFSYAGVLPLTFLLLD